MDLFPLFSKVYTCGHAYHNFTKIPFFSTVNAFLACVLTCQKLKYIFFYDSFIGWCNIQACVMRQGMQIMKADHEWPWYWLRKYVCFWRSEALIKKAIRKAFKLKDFKMQGLHSALLTPLLKCAQKYHICIFAYWWRIRLYYTDNS